MTSTTAVSVAPTLHAGETIRRSDRRLGVVMLAPALLYIVLLVAVPFLLAVFLSLTNSSAGSLEFSFVGLQNFKNVMASPVYQRAQRHTFTFTLFTHVTVLHLSNVL